jgi:hypothetical protein
MALSILAVPEFAFSPRLTLKTTSMWGDESIWSRLLKIAYWNGLNAAELVYLFGPTICLPATLIEPRRGAFQRALGHFLAGDAMEDLADAFPPAMADRLPDAASVVLRGCADCYRLGFHSALFQSLAIARCPIHGGNLIVGCPSCKYSETYAIPTALRRNGYRCANCGRVILRLDPVAIASLAPLVGMAGWRAAHAAETEIRRSSGTLTGYLPAMEPALC